VERHHKFANVITTTVMRLILTKRPRKASQLDLSNGSFSEIDAEDRHVRLSPIGGHGRDDRWRPKNAPTDDELIYRSPRRTHFSPTSRSFSTSYGKKASAVLVMVRPYNMAPIVRRLHLFVD
jgi:hypothetical protein